MSEVWVHSSGTTSKFGLDDFPKIEILTEEQAKSVIAYFVDEEIEQVWDDGPSWDGTEIEDERVDQLMEVILEGEDTLFARVDKAKDELIEIIWKKVKEDRGFWFLFDDGSDGWFWQLEPKEIP